MGAISYLLVFTALLAVSVISQDLPKVDYDLLLNNQPYVETQIQCVNKKSPNVCDRVGTRLRDVLLPAVAKTGSCDTCNAEEKIFIGKAGWLIKNKYPKEWDTLLEVYKVAPDIRPKVLEKEMAGTTPPKSALPK